jgi:hypothetical protein
LQGAGFSGAFFFSSGWMIVLGTVPKLPIGNRSIRGGVRRGKKIEKLNPGLRLAASHS